MKTRIVPPILLLFVLAANLTPSRASTVIQMSFEQVTDAADVIVQGRVTEIPEYGERDAAHGVIVRSNKFLVARYLKGSGSDVITILTLGGKYIEVRNGQQEEMSNVITGQAQLPAVGTEALLFLKRYGGPDSFMICSASHGVVEVQKHTDTGDKSVVLLFSRPDVMPPGALASYRRAGDDKSSPGAAFAATVAVEDLPVLIRKVSTTQKATDEAKP